MVNTIWFRAIATLLLGVGARFAMAQGADAPRIYQAATLGGDRRPGDGGPATSAYLQQPVGVAADSKGNVYLAEAGAARIRRIKPTGIIETVVGQLANCLAVAPDDTLYFADNFRIYKIDANGTVVVVAGSGNQTSTGIPGPVLTLDFKHIADLAFDNSGTLYVADGDGFRIWQLRGGSGTVLLGTGVDSLLGTVDGPVPASGAGTIASPVSIATDSSGNLYFLEGGAYLREVSGGRISTIAGGGTHYSFPAYPIVGSLEAIFRAKGLAISPVGDIYFSEYCSSQYECIVRIQRDATQYMTFSEVAGSNQVESLAMDPKGDLIVPDSVANVIRELDPQGHFVQIAGGPNSAGDGGPVANAIFNGPTGVAVDTVSRVFIADAGNYQVRRVDAAGVITTIFTEYGSCGHRYDCSGSDVDGYALRNTFHSDGRQRRCGFPFRALSRRRKSPDMVVSESGRRWKPDRHHCRPIRHLVSCGARARRGSGLGWTSRPGRHDFPGGRRRYRLLRR